MELEDKMKQLHYIEQIDEAEVNKEEKQCKQDYKAELRKVNAEKEAALLEAKNAELRERMNRVY